MFYNYGYLGANVRSIADRALRIHNELEFFYVGLIRVLIDLKAFPVHSDT